MEKLTPAMHQYMKAKSQYPDCVLLMRMGDFYETFYEDAKLVARVLQITLTSRGGEHSKVPLAGIPYHALEPYLAKLIKAGYKVAIVEQLEDPKLAKGVVKRDIVRIITPGSVMEDVILDSKANNYIMSIYPDGNNSGNFGVSLADVSTGEFICSCLSKEKLYAEISRLSPSEIVIPATIIESEFASEIKKFGAMVNNADDFSFWFDNAHAALKKHFNILSLEGFGISDSAGSPDSAMVSSSGGLLSYLKEMQRNSLSQITKIKRYVPDEFMFIDSTTKRNLELVSNIRDNGKSATLLEVLDKTLTSLGARKLKRWLLHPLNSRDEINKRLDAVEELKNSHLKILELSELLKQVSDIERIISRVSFGSVSPRDLIALKNSFDAVPRIKDSLKLCSSSLLKEISEMNTENGISQIIGIAINENPPAATKEGNFIKKGYDKNLDEIRLIESDAKSYLAELEENEKRKTGIKSLKISYNRVFGYYIEVTKTNLNLVPQNYIRKQTQVNAERFITQELKEKEELILTAKERMISLEQELFQKIVEEIKSKTAIIQDIADKIAVLDCVLAFSRVSLDNNYVRPEINSNARIFIKAGRHPVVEQLANKFVPNDCVLDDKNKLMIITGPNMSGKSTFLRQVALITLMAHVGCFVPAESASVCIVDRIFTRIGAYDDLAHGQSTFMVEMTETANILNNSTRNSLVIMDELGRGTSTYDGVSLAWAIAEHIYKEIGSKTLFATHYHHLNKLAENFSGIKNLNTAVHESGDNIVFLHKILDGGTDKSYGIQVAKLAGIPSQVIERSKAIMEMIEMEDELEEILDKNPETDVLREKISRIKSKKRFQHEDSEKQKNLFDGF